MTKPKLDVNLQLANDFLKLFLLSYILSIFTQIAFNGVNGFFIFLGWLFLIASVLGYFHKIDIKGGSLAFTGSASVIFFLLAWFVPIT